MKMGIKKRNAIAILVVVFIISFLLAIAIYGLKNIMGKVLIYVVCASFFGLVLYAFQKNKIF